MAQKQSTTRKVTYILKKYLNISELSLLIYDF